MSRIFFAFLLFFQAYENLSAMSLQCEYSARDTMHMCFENVKNGNLNAAYSFFVGAISDKNDDPGYYPILKAIGESNISDFNLSDMWNEYGITDYARDAFLQIPMETLKKSLQSIINGQGQKAN